MKRAWLLITDPHGILRGKLVPKCAEKLSTMFSGVFTNDPLDKIIPFIRNADGALNVEGQADTSSFRDSPWNEEETYVFCNAYVNDLPSKMCCRTLLRQVELEYEALGYKITCGMELEWALFDRDDRPVVGPTVCYSMFPHSSPRINEYSKKLLESCMIMDISVEAFHTEAGVSMFEAALAPSGPVTIGDNVQLFRMAAKREAAAHDMRATFVAKPIADAAGCGAHIHVSLQTEDNRNATDVLLGPFLAGILESMRDCTLMLLPFANSYQRVIQGEFWTANKVSYGLDNRNDAVRIVNPGGPDARLEIRLGGGDVNPYLALYYVLSAGLWGIRNGKNCNVSPEETVTDLPSDLKTATKLFLQDKSVARVIMSDEFVEHYGDQKMFETSQCLKRPANWEKQIF